MRSVRRSVHLGQGGDTVLDDNAELGATYFSDRLSLRAAFIGGNIDAASAFARWSMRWAEHLGVREDRNRVPAPKPVVELFVFSPDDSVELAYAVAYMCEIIWGEHRFAGIAHVANDRIEALRDSRLIVDTTTAPRSSRSGFDLEAYRSSSRMDAMMFAPQSELFFVDDGVDLMSVLPQFD